MIIIFLLFLFCLLIYKTVTYYKNEKLGWKVSKKSYKEIIYKEKINGVWKQIVIDADINFGTFEPYFKNDDEWLNYPKWAQNRKQIIDRVKKTFKIKDSISEIGSH